MILQEKIKKEANSYGKLAPAFIEGANFALKNPWINAKDDLPCNHKELIEEVHNTQITKVVIVKRKDGGVTLERMIKHEGIWRFVCKVTHWMPIPEVSKE